MSDLLEDPHPGSNDPEFSVSEISGAVKRVVEGEFAHIRVRGEVGRVMVARTGHMYFDLKDDRATLSAVSWKGTVGRLSVRPEEGMEIIATGRLTTFPGQSRYQMVVEEVAPAGLGALMAMLEKRKAALAAEGLFAAERKRPLPFLPEVIGVVTSPQGAVIRDILHRLRDRFPRRVLIWPVAVQGKDCAPQVAAAIRGFNALLPGGAVPRPDLIIVARGGGSIEDLWGFNEEAVVRAAAESHIPLISAVGHETDTTLIDFAADRRAPTPTAAAEMAVPVRMDLLAAVEGQGARITRAAGRGLADRRQRLLSLARLMPRAEALLAQPRQRLDLWAERLPRGLAGFALRRRGEFARTEARLSPRLLAAGLAQRRARVADWERRLAPALARLHERRAEALSARAARLALGLRRLGTEALRGRERLGLCVTRLETALPQAIQRRRERLEALDRLRQTLGYRETLRRGFAVVRAEEHLVSRRARAATAAWLEIEFADGKLVARPAPAEGDAGPGPGAAPSRASLKASPDAPEALATMAPHRAPGPGTPLIDTADPGTTLGEAALPDTPLPDTALPETLLPNTPLPDPPLPDTALPNTALPETPLPETAHPHTAHPGRSLPEIVPAPAPSPGVAPAGPRRRARATPSASESGLGAVSPAPSPAHPASSPGTPPEEPAAEAGAKSAGRKAPDRKTSDRKTDATKPRRKSDAPDQGSLF